MSFIQSDKDNNLLILTRGANINLVGTIVRTTLLYSYAFLVARMAGANAFGLYTLGLTLISFPTMLSEMGLGKGVIKYIGSFQTNKLNTDAKNALQGALLSGVVISVSVAFAILLFANFISTQIFHDINLSSILKFLAVSIPLIVISNIIISFTQALKTMRYKFYFRDILQPFIELVIVIIFLGYGLKAIAIGLAISYTTSYFIIDVILILIVNRFVPQFFNNHSNSITNSLKNLLRFSVPIMGGDVILNSLPKISTFIIAIFLSNQMVGVYNIVLRISMVSVLIIMSFNSMFAPIISELYTKGDIEQLQTLFKKVTTSISLLSAPILGICVIFPSFILHLFGEEFISGEAPLVVLSIGQLINIATGPVMYILIMIGRSKEYILITLYALLASIILGVVLVSHFGLLGASITDAFIGGIMNVTMLFIVYKKLKIHPYNRNFFYVIFALLIAGIAALVISRQNIFLSCFPSEVIGSIVFIIIYFIVTVRMGLYKNILAYSLGATWHKF